MKIFEVDYYDGEDVVGIKLFTNEILANDCVLKMRDEGKRAEKQTWHSIEHFIVGFQNENWSDGEVLDLLCDLDGDKDETDS